MPDPVWTHTTREPADWNAWIRECGGGIFQSPLSLLIGEERGAHVYWAYGLRADSPIGVALSLSKSCRFSRRQRHLRFASLPALQPSVDTGVALEALRRVAVSAGAADVQFGSFDATWLPPDGVEPRLEYVMRLGAPDPMEGIRTTHRRAIRRGEREGWEIRILTGAAARDAVTDAHGSTAARAKTRDRGFEKSEATGWQDSLTPALPLPPAGLAVFAALADDALLSSVLVGWAAGRAFYHIGGSTPEGFSRSSAAWLHWKVMQLLFTNGLSTYNFGGAPLGAADEGHPANGLHRFKSGFGVEPHECRGVRWIGDRRHMAMHSLLARLRRGT